MVKKKGFMIVVCLCCFMQFDKVLAQTDDNIIIPDEIPVPDHNDDTTPDSTQFQNHLRDETPTTLFQFVTHEIPKDPSTPPSESKTIDDEAAIKVKIQKCCKAGQVMVSGKPGEKSSCEDSDEKLIIDVFFANVTHYWNYTSSVDKNVDIVARDPCGESKYFLEPKEDQNDTFFLLHNASLYIPARYNMYKPDDYCVDIIKINDDYLTTALICTPVPQKSPFYWVYIGGICTSILSLIILTAYLSKRTDININHKKCIMFFAVTMAMSFSFEIAYMLLDHTIGALVIAYIILYLKYKFYIWLSILCFDTYRYNKNYDKLNNGSYINYYMYIAFLSPLIFIFINFGDGFRPALPNIYTVSGYVYSSSQYWCLLYFVPVVLLTVANLIVSIFFCPPVNIKHTKLNELIQLMSNPNWIPPDDVKKINKRRQYLFTFVFIIVIFDCIMFSFSATGERMVSLKIREVFYSLQGFFIALMFVRKEWLNNICCKKEKTPPLNITESIPLTDISNGNV